MYCPFFELIHNTGVCNALKNGFIPGIDRMSRLCFKDDFAACPMFNDACQDTTVKSSERTQPVRQIICLSDIKPKVEVLSRQ